MTSRFGRNKRRRARQEIERLGGENISLRNHVRYAEFRAENARQEALNMFIEHSHIYKEAIKECAYALGRALGEELNKHTDKLLGTVIREPMQFNYRLDHNMAQKAVNIVEVRIPLRDLIYSRAVSL